MNADSVIQNDNLLPELAFSVGLITHMVGNLQLAGFILSKR